MTNYQWYVRPSAATERAEIKHETVPQKAKLHDRMTYQVLDLCYLKCYIHMSLSLLHHFLNSYSFAWVKKKVVGQKPIKHNTVISCNLLLNSFPEKESYAMSNTIPLPWHRGSHSFSISSAVEEPITLLQDSTAEGFCQPSNEMIAIWAKHANIKSDQTKEFWKHRVSVSFSPQRQHQNLTKIKAKTSDECTPHD